jgi:hypothetical protein
MEGVAACNAWGRDWKRVASAPPLLFLFLSLDLLLFLTLLLLLLSPSQVVLGAVNEDLANPYDSVLAAGRHEQKLRTWKGMGPEQK